MSSLETLEYNRTTLVDDELCYIWAETLQGVTSIHFIPRQWSSGSVRKVQKLFDDICAEFREQGIGEIINMIDPDPKLDKLHKLFGFEYQGSWRDLDVYMKNVS